MYSLYMGICFPSYSSCSFANRFYALAVCSYSIEPPSIGRRQMLSKKHKETFDELSKLQKSILDDQLTSWQRHQQLAGNGAPLEGDLDTIQQWSVTSFAEL